MNRKPTWMPILHILLCWTISMTLKFYFYKNSKIEKSKQLVGCTDIFYARKQLQKFSGPCDVDAPAEMLEAVWWKILTKISPVQKWRKISKNGLIGWLGDVFLHLLIPQPHSQPLSYSCPDWNSILSRKIRPLRESILFSIHDLHSNQTIT